MKKFKVFLCFIFAMSVLIFSVDAVRDFHQTSVLNKNASRSYRENISSWKKIQRFNDHIFIKLSNLLIEKRVACAFSDAHVSKTAEHLMNRNLSNEDRIVGEIEGIFDDWMYGLVYETRSPLREQIEHNYRNDEVLDWLDRVRVIYVKHILWTISSWMPPTT